MVASLEPDYFEFDSELYQFPRSFVPVSPCPITVHKEDLSTEQLKGVQVRGSFNNLCPDTLLDFRAALRGGQVICPINLSYPCCEDGVFIFIHCIWHKHTRLLPFLCLTVRVPCSGLVSEPCASDEI